MLVNSLIDEVIDDGACNFHHSVAEPLPSQVFLTMFGLPVERTAEFIELKNTGTVSVDLSQLDLVLVNGSGGGATIYDTIMLPSTTAFRPRSLTT